MSLSNKTDSSYENKEIILLNFIMKMLVWKAQWDVKDQYDKEFNDLYLCKIDPKIYSAFYSIKHFSKNLS